MYFKFPFTEASISPIWGLNRYPDSLAYTILPYLVPDIVNSTMLKIHLIISSFWLHGHQLSSNNPPGIVRMAGGWSHWVSKNHRNWKKPMHWLPCKHLWAVRHWVKWMARWVGGSLFGRVFCQRQSPPPNILILIHLKKRLHESI